MSRYSASRDIMYTAPPGPDADESAAVDAETPADAPSADAVEFSSDAVPADDD